MPGMVHDPSFWCKPEVIKTPSSFSSLYKFFLFESNLLSVSVLCTSILSDCFVSIQPILSGVTDIFVADPKEKNELKIKMI